jgi:hypothetical protein
MPAGKIKSSASDVIKDKTPNFTDFYFDSIYCNGAQTAISITGLSEMVSKIYFKNIIISCNKGFEALDASDIYLDKVKIISEKDPVFLLNNVKNITIKNAYRPANSKTFYKANTETSGVKITED